MFYEPFIKKSIRDVCMAAFVDLTDNPREFALETDRWVNYLNEINKAYPEASCVYFVEKGDVVKIGMTSNLKRRMRCYATDSEVDPRLRFVIPVKTRDAAEDLETYVHKIWVGKRLNGEWFQNKTERLKDVLWDFVCALYQSGEDYYAMKEAM